MPRIKPGYKHVGWELPEDVIEAVKLKAARDDRTIRATVERMLRAQLEAEAAGSEAAS